MEKSFLFEKVERLFVVSDNFANGSHKSKEILTRVYSWVRIKAEASFIVRVAIIVVLAILIVGIVLLLLYYEVSSIVSFAFFILYSYASFSSSSYSLRKCLRNLLLNNLLFTFLLIGVMRLVIQTAGSLFFITCLLFGYAVLWILCSIGFDLSITKLANEIVIALSTLIFTTGVFCASYLTNDTVVNFLNNFGVSENLLKEINVDISFPLMFQSFFILFLYFIALSTVSCILINLKIYWKDKYCK